jgi:hypothetical protein
MARVNLLDKNGLTDDVVPDAHPVTFIEFELPSVVALTISYNDCEVVRHPVTQLG